MVNIILEGFKQRQEHDKLKDDYCKNNGITMIRIKQKEYKNMENILINVMQLNKIA